MPTISARRPGKPEICKLTGDSAGRWLAAGWADMRNNPIASLIPGGICAQLGYLAILGAVLDGRYLIIFPLLAGFLFTAPFVAVGVYEISRRREVGETVTLSTTFAAYRRNRVQITLMGLLLTAWLSIWVWLALQTFHGFFGDEPSILLEGLGTASTLGFLVVSNAIGGAMAVIAFMATAVSLPMLLDQRTDVITAMSTSWRACVANPQTMAWWAILIALVTTLGLVTFFVGLVVILPLLGHASWHAYRDLVAFTPPARQTFGRPVQLFR